MEHLYVKFGYPSFLRYRLKKNRQTTAVKISVHDATANGVHVLCKFAVLNFFTTANCRIVQSSSVQYVAICERKGI